MANIQTQQDLTLGFYDEFGDITIYAKQGDTQRYIRFEFTEDVIPEDKSHFFAYVRGKYSDDSLIPIERIIDKDSIESQETMPEPSEALLGYIYKYTGVTGTYINGHCYKCVKNIIITQTKDENDEDITIRSTEYSWKEVTIDDEIGSNYILFHVPADMLAISGRTVCDLVLCEGNGTINVNPDGTISNDQIKILSTHKFIIHVEALPTDGGNLTPIQRSEMDELTTLVVAARDMTYEKGIMNLFIDENGDLIYQCTTDMENMNFSIQDHKNLILTIN